MTPLNLSDLPNTVYDMVLVAIDGARAGAAEITLSSKFCIRVLMIRIRPRSVYVPS